MIGLSVSSVGSSPLQHSRFPGPRPGSHFFQYPRSDRAHCNTAWIQHMYASLKDFQYPRSDRAHCNVTLRPGGGAPRSTFSILGRIEPTATAGSPVADLPTKSLSVSSVGSSPLQQSPGPRRTPGKRSFSILGRIEPTATSDKLGREFPLRVFQYPRSDRAHCNRRLWRLGQDREVPFSILGRIEPTATP